MRKIYIVITSIVIFIGVLGYMLYNNGFLSLKNNFSIQEYIPFSSNISNPQNSQVNSISISEVTSNEEKYSGQVVQLTGLVKIQVFHSERPCKVSDAVCDTSMGARVELWQTDSEGRQTMIVLSKDSKPYPCEKTAPSTYVCAPFKDGQNKSIMGEWTKTRVATKYIGSSDPNSIPKPIAWEDRYFFNVR